MRKWQHLGGFSDINLIIAKATAPSDFPLQEKYILELLKIFSTSSSSSSFHSFYLSFTRRFAKTHCWKVALKCLLLLHRLLRSLPERSPLRTELLWARSNGLLCLQPCLLRDDSSSTPRDYTSFIRSFACLLDDVLSCFASQDGKEEEDECDDKKINEETTTLSLKDKIQEANRLLEVLPQLQNLIGRVMDCMPTGLAATSSIVKAAMKHIIRDSFICYTTFRKDIVLVLDNLFQMPYKSSILAFGISKKAALQADRLCEFYDWCKAKGLCGAYEYPLIDRIPQIQIQALESFLNGMWQMSQQWSTTLSPSYSLWPEECPRSSSTEDDGHEDKQLAVARREAVNIQCQKFEEKDESLPLMFKGSHEEMPPLIQLEDSKNERNWEDLLEASVDISQIPRSNDLINPPNNRDWKFEGNGGEGNVRQEENNNQLQLQVYNPNDFNPFYIA